MGLLLLARTLYKYRQGLAAGEVATYTDAKHVQVSTGDGAHVVQI